MNNKVQNGLKLLGYKNQAVYDDFSKIVEEGPKNTHYTHIVSFATDELRTLCGIDEKVNPITSPEDYVSFLMELSSFLKELGCPYEMITQGHISERLSTTEERLLLLDYLLTELMAARMLRENVPEKKIELKLNETANAANLRKILMTLGISKPPANITVAQLFQKLTPSIDNVIKKGGSDLLGNPILNVMLNDRQWHTLSNLQKDLHHEYTIRREMMLTRLDCTIESFQWSDKTKGKENDINKKYSDKRRELRVEPEVGLSDLMCARDDLAIIEKTSNASVRKNTQTAINKIIIGQVPDRGGRTSEQAPPPPEMPSWQQRSTAPQGGRGGGRGGYGGGDRGAYNRGNTNDNYNNQRSTQNYDSAGSFSGSYNTNRGNYNRGNGDNYSRGNNDSYSRGNNDSYSRGNNDNYSRGNNDSYSRGNSHNYSKDNYSRENAEGDNYNNRNNSGYGRGNNYSGGFDSAGSYGGYQEYASNEPKRAKTYDRFQSNKTTYADQYVEESRNNQQYQSREYSRGGRGKSNYNRGNNRNHY